MHLQVLMEVLLICKGQPGVPFVAGVGRTNKGGYENVCIGRGR